MNLKGYKWITAPTKRVDILKSQMRRIINAMNKITGGEMIFLSDNSSVSDFSYIIDNLDKLLAKKLKVEVKMTDKFCEIAERLPDDSTNN